jgi:hypothetical protein
MFKNAEKTSAIIWSIAEVYSIFVSTIAAKIANAIAAS